jgi:hypothetical protein
VVTEREAGDGLLLAAATLIVPPLLPDRTLGPYGALNPHAIWLVVLVRAMGGVGHVAARALGPPLWAVGGGPRLWLRLEHRRHRRARRARNQASRRPAAAAAGAEPAAL